MGRGGLAGAAAYVYSHIAEFQLRSKYRHLQRIWNYLDDINTGAGDDERYRVFCSGRSAGLTALGLERFPAATAIGRRDGSHRLQVYWLAARSAGLALENPRQVSAYRYPRRYGPVAPGFSRAMLAPGIGLLISGTASVVGHASHHPGDLVAQLEETVNNLQTVLDRANAHWDYAHGGPTTTSARR